MSQRSRKAALRRPNVSYQPSPKAHGARILPDVVDRSPLFSRKSIGPVLGGAVGGALILYVASVAYNVRSDARRVADKDVPADASNRFDSIADRFDRSIDSQEAISSIKSARKQLCALARGHVLEASVGTGRNMEVLPLTGKRMKSIVMVDKSREMIEVARRKWPDVGNGFFVYTKFRVQDLAHEKVPCPVPEGFDTVIQTMGLCSTGEPVKVLQNLADMTNPDTGRILLLEHGRSSWDLVNRFLDYSAKAHADRYGCWYNKDIGDIVRRSGLEIVEEKRFDLGTTYWYVLKPAAQKASGFPADTPHAPVSAPQATFSWFGWIK